MVDPRFQVVRAPTVTQARFAAGVGYLCLQCSNVTVVPSCCPRRCSSCIVLSRVVSSRVVSSRVVSSRVVSSRVVSSRVVPIPRGSALDCCSHTVRQVWFDAIRPVSARQPGAVRYRVYEGAAQRCAVHPHAAQHQAWRALTSLVESMSVQQATQIQGALLCERCGS